MLVNRIHKPYLCNICKKATGVKACKCQKAFYCSRNCQKIDWNVHKSDCLFKLTDHRAITTKTTSNSTDPIISASAHDILLHQHHQQQHYSNVDSAILVQQPEHSQNVLLDTLEEARRTYDPTPLQYQQPHATYTENTFTTTTTHSSTGTVDDFEENLFNSLMYSVVNESTEQEILKNLNIRADDLLSTYTLDSDISSSLNCPQTLKEYVPNSVGDDQTLSDKIFNQETFEFRPETQKLFAETKETLEKELSLFCENNHLNEQQDQTMQLSTTNPKYVTHTKVQDNNMMRTADEQMALEEMSCTLIRDLNEYGVCVLDNFVGEEQGLKVLEEVKCMYSAGLFRDGQLVSTTKSNLDHKHIRSDKIMWVDGKEQGLYNIKYLMNQVDAVITLANRMRNNGKLGQYNIRERTKAMVACYNGQGSHYVKHVDNPNKDGRCITCIYYLNVNWNVQESGGLLRIFPDGCDRIADIEPIFDRITFFWSDRRNPHEVQPAYRTRYAITLWYFDAHEREAAVRKYRKDCENLLKAA